MKLGSMDLSGVPLGGQGQSAVVDTGAAQLGNKVLDAFIQRLAQEDELFEGKKGRGGGGSSLRETLELFKLMQELQGGGDRPTAKDAGFSDLAGVFSKMMGEQMAMMKEMYSHNTKSSDTPKEKSEADQFFQQLAMQVVQGSLNQNPRSKIKEDLEDLVGLQQTFGGMLQSQNREPSLQEKLAMKKLDLEIARIHADTEQKKNDTASQNDLYAGALQSLNEFLKDRREQRHGDEGMPLNRTAGSVDAPARQTPAHRIHCRSCAQDVVIMGPPDAQGIHYCPICGHAEDDETLANTGGDETFEGGLADGDA